MATRAPAGHKTVKEALEILAISAATFWLYVSKGKINVKKVTGRTLITDEELARVLRGE